MAQGPIGKTGGRARHGLAVLSLGVILTGPAWAAAAEKKAEGSEVSRIAVHPRLLDSLQSLQPEVALGTPTVPPGLITEVEPNDTTATAQALPGTSVRLRGDLYRAPGTPGVDEDVYSFTAAAGDRVYASTMTGFSGGSTDTLIDIIDVGGVTILETDDNDGSVATASSSVAGTLLATGGTYFVRVRQVNLTLTGTVRPYDLYVRVLSGTPAAEVEPNNNGGPPNLPNPVPANGWVSGTINPTGDNDVFSVAANAGDTIVANLDVNPERDATTWDARLGIGVFNNFLLLVNGSGASTVANPHTSEVFFMTVRTTGTYLIFVDQNPPLTGALTNTYNLSVSVIPGTTRNCTTYTGAVGPIADAPAITDFTLNIPDLATIDRLQFSLSATHAFPSDLDVSLISPDGNEVVLFDELGDVATAPAPQINFTLDDEAGVPVGTTGIHSGMIASPRSFARLAYFKGMQAQGNWTLRVRDDFAADTGTVNSWSLNVCAADPLPFCAAPGEITILTTDFETGPAGFTHTGTPVDEWELGTPAFAPITTAHSGANAFKTDLDNTYDASANLDLLSPNINLVGVTGRVTLNWWQKYQMESASFDTYYVEVREVGLPANFRRVFEWKGATQTRSVGTPAATINQSAGWGLVQADISDFAGVNTEIRFHLESDTTVQLAGVAIDDVSVTSCAVVDLIFKDGFE